MRASNPKWRGLRDVPRGIPCAVMCIAALLPPLQSWAAGPAGAPLALSLDYSATADCPGADDFKSIVVGRLGYDPFGDALPEHVLVEIATRPPAFEGRIEWRDAEGNWAGDRTFPSRSEDCGELARAMAFALALQIQLAASARAPAAAANHPPQVAAQLMQDAPSSPPPPPPVPGSDAQKTMATVTETATATPTAPRSRPVLAVGAGALVAFGVSPSPVPLGRLLADLAWAHLALELDAEVGLPSTVRRADGAGFSQQPLLSGVAGCALYARLRGCLVGKAGAVRVVGEDIDVPASPWVPLVATGVRLSVWQPLGRRFYATAQAEGLLLVTRWRVTLDRTAVWTSSRFAETVGLDLGVRFP